MSIEGTHPSPELFEEFKKHRNSSQSCQEFEEENAKLYAMACLIDKSGKEAPEDEYFNSIGATQILKRRIEVFKLPITFTMTGIIGMLAMTNGVPGRAVVLLVDCLNELPPGSVVNASTLGEIYPWGFYKEEIFGRYVDEVMKPKKINWSHIY